MVFRLIAGSEVITNISLAEQKQSKSNKPVQSYHEKDVLGCPHYQRSCLLEASCCGSDCWTPCRLCHDSQVPEHNFDRYKVARVKCMRCGEIQVPGKRCTSAKCRKPFANYFCDVCKLYDDTPGKSIFHCDECGLCRVGERKNYRHCHRCCACIAISNWASHKCVENALKDQCPICFDEMFQSTIEVMFLRCGHACHAPCLEELVKHDYRCPVCSKSIAEDTSAINSSIDRYLRDTSMPKEYENKKNVIFCSDCELRSVAKFHYVYHKCLHCGGYNTCVLETVSASKTAKEGEAAGNGENLEGVENESVAQQGASYLKKLFSKKGLCQSVAVVAVSVAVGYYYMNSPDQNVNSGYDSHIGTLTNVLVGVKELFSTWANSFLKLFY
eukprot:Nk52_evm13s2284 gene=Nk52_evmTU13s2284